MLRDHGWRVTFLGADTPVATITETVRRVAPEVVVLAMLKPLELDPADVKELARGPRVLISGAGASPELVRTLGAEHFPGGPIDAAGFLANGAPARR